MDRSSFDPQPKTKEVLPCEYAREAYKRGLAYEAELGVNPFTFGLVEFTDSHTSLSTMCVCWRSRRWRTGMGDPNDPAKLAIVGDEKMEGSRIGF